MPYTHFFLVTALKPKMNTDIYIYIINSNTEIPPTYIVNNIYLL